MRGLTRSFANNPCGRLTQAPSLSLKAPWHVRPRQCLEDRSRSRLFGGARLGASAPWPGARRRTIAASSAEARLTGMPAGMSAHKQQEIVASVWQVNGHPTEVLKLPATNDPPDVQLLIIAGNPGAAPFYTPFLRQLSGRLGGCAAVTAISNLGMVGGCLARGPLGLAVAITQPSRFC